MSAIHTSDPPNPLGHFPGAREPVIAVLTVPKTWTRLVVACVGLLFVVVLLVAMMVYISWRTALFNSGRIDAINERIGHIEARQQGR